MAKLPKPEIHVAFDLTKLRENPDNPRVLSKEGERKLDASLGEFGMLDTIVANRREDGSLVVCGGHQRLKAMLKAGETKGLVSIVQVDEIAEKKLCLILNGHHGQWDGDKLEAMLSDLSQSGVELHDLGLDGMAAFEEISADLANAAEALEGAGGGEPETKEIDPDSFNLKHRCPKCGFEYDKETTAEGRRAEGPGKRTVKGERPAEADEDEAPAPKATRARRHQVVDDDE